MRNHIARFCREDCGAITVDWVFLTAMVVGLAAAVIFSINATTGGLGSSVAETLVTSSPK